ncbi:MAG: TetR/AcrR family transcriptional regulator [Caulobacter sp.]|nr:TetR/AcrR family transcriptional regulator [Caulobacter sp.]
MQPGQPKWRRRSQARPGEIIEAALEVFAEKGFAAARLDDIAARAGVSKGALYLYFETKQDLFRAVVRETVAPNLAAVEAFAAQEGLAFADLVGLIFGRIGEVLAQGRLGPVAKMVIGESRNFPELAKVWHEDVVSRVLNALGGAVAAAQARGEVRPGDPRLYVVSLAGPLLTGVLWREVFVPIGAEPMDMKALLAQHAQVVLGGMLVEPSRAGAAA